MEWLQKRDLTPCEVLEIMSGRVWHLLLRELKAFPKSLGSLLIVLPVFVQAPLPAEWGSMTTPGDSCRGCCAEAKVGWFFYV